MLSLNDREWENFKLTDIFDNISRGTRLTKYNRLPGNTPLITAGYQNYGVGGYISNSDQKRFSNAITIDMFCNVFYRGLEFCCDDNIIVLQNSKLNKYQMQFMVPLIQAKSCNYSYGNQYRLDDLKRHEVLLPIECNGNPDYDFMEQYVRERAPDYSWVTKCFKNVADLKLTDREWKEFKVNDIFEFTRGKRITKAFALNNIGDIPVIAGGEANNGVLCYLNEKCKTIRVLKDSCITVAAYGTAGCVHYHNYKCFIDDKALALNIKDIQNDNKYVNMFLVTILKTLEENYSYGRGVTIDRYGEESINIPITPEGNPDYDFMEQYIKSLPFSIVI